MIGRVPDDDRVEDLSWAMSTGGHDFWSLVDSRPAWGFGRTAVCTDDCFNGYGNPDCRKYSHQRGTKQCIAANSQQGRCSSWVAPGAPFCHNHLEKAWEVLYTRAAATERDLLVSELQMMKESAKTELAEIAERHRLDSALIEDLGRAASRLPERVYFFAVADAVKIGRSVDPEKRVRTLSGTKSPEGIDLTAGALLGTVPGGHRLERELHGRFCRHRLVGEWFELPPIRDEVVRIIADAQERAA